MFYSIKRDRARRDPARWPSPIQALVKASPELKSAIKTYDLEEGFLETTMMISISGKPEVIGKIISDFGLVATNQNHRKAKHLLKSIPSDWRRPSPSCAWYATPGFGTVHREGADLFLIAVDPEGVDAVILYNWIF